MAGVDPDPRTMRELVWMADGRRRDEWSRASLLAALLFNQWKKRQHMRSPAQFDPFQPRHRGRRIKPANISDLKVFLQR